MNVLAILFVFIGGVLLGIGGSMIQASFLPNQSINKTKYSRDTNDGHGNFELRVTNRQFLDLFITQKNVTSSILSMTLPIQLKLGSVIDLLVKLDRGSDFYYEGAIKIDGLSSYQLEGTVTDTGLQIVVLELQDNQHTVLVNLDRIDQAMLKTLLLKAAQDMTSET